MGSKARKKMSGNRWVLKALSLSEPSAGNFKEPFDFMGFQECGDGTWVMKDAGRLGSLSAGGGVIR